MTPSPASRTTIPEMTTREGERTPGTGMSTEASQCSPRAMVVGTAALTAWVKKAATPVA